MTYVVWVVLVGLSVWSTVVFNRGDPGWSTKQFLAVLGMAAGLGAVISLPWFFLSWETVDAHPGLVIGSILLAILVGVTWITVVATRWRRRTLAQRAAARAASGARSGR